MQKDTPGLNGHSAPWSRRPAPAAAAAPTRVINRWPWVILAALIAGAIGWLIYDAALG